VHGGFLRNEGTSFSCEGNIPKTVEIRMVRCRSKLMVARSVKTGGKCPRMRFTCVTLPTRRRPMGRGLTARTAMTTLVRRIRLEGPCRKCAGRGAWLLRYDSPGLRRFVSICDRCGNSSVHMRQEDVSASGNGPCYERGILRAVTKPVHYHLTG
jgi:hypothetical protein